MGKLLSKILGGSEGAKDIIKEVGSAIDNITTSKEEKLLIELEEKKAVIEDLQSARKMQETALQQDDKFSKRFAAYLTIVSIIVSFTYIFCITFMEIKPENQRFADTILGVVISLVIGSIYTFWFGSSAGSSRKTDALVNAAKIRGE